jgi:hypothetical protein
MADPPQMGDPGQEPREERSASPASPATDGGQAVQLGGGVPAGLLALAGLHDGGHLELVALGDGLAQGEQEPLAGQGRQGRRPGLLSGLGGLLAGFQGRQRPGLVRLLQGRLLGPPQLDLGWGADNALGHVDRLGRAHGRRS